MMELTSAMDETSLIPRRDFLAPGSRSAPLLSPDGDRIAFLAPHEGAQNLWLAPVSNPHAAEPVTFLTSSEIRSIVWSAEGDRILVLRDRSGNENTSAYSFDPASGQWRSLSPSDEGECRFAAISPLFPDVVAVETNHRNPGFFDLWRVNIKTGDGEILLRNDEFTWLHVDRHLNPRLGEVRCDDGSVEFKVRGDGGSAEWRSLIHVPADDEASTRPFRIYELSDPFDHDGHEIYAMDSRGRDTAAIAAWNLETGEARILAENNGADATALLTHAQTSSPLAWCYSYDRPHMRALTTEVEREFAYLKGALRSDPIVTNQSADGKTWIVTTNEPHLPSSHCIYDRTAQDVKPLYGEYSALINAPLRATEQCVLRSRDGLNLVSYLTLPRDRNHAPHPMVVLIHGGPWIRDDYVFDPWVQLLANRGYAVLNVNYRGSRGFGKSFLCAGDREWGGKMFEDILDGTSWAIDRGVADPKRIALMGASFGGYSTLVGLSREPDMFACGVDMFGVSNLVSFLQSIPPYWKSLKQMWNRRVGDVDDDCDLQMLNERSPLNYADRIVRPVLIAQGGHDPRVVKSESDRMVEALQSAGTQVSYLFYEDEGHNFYQTTNQLSFFACVEAFLAKHLGGQQEPILDALEGSSLRVPVGAEHIPGLTEALDRTN